MITLIETCDKRKSNKSNKRQHQKPKNEDLQFFDEELLYGNDNSLSEEEELNPDCNINDRTFSEQKLKPECTHNLPDDLKETLLRENIRASNVLITERIRELLRENEVTHENEDRKCLSKKRRRMKEKKQKKIKMIFID